MKGEILTMGKMRFTGRSSKYLFDGAGGKRDQLEQAILSEMDVKQYPLKRTIKDIKAGGLLFGTKEQCVVIEIDKDAQIIISNNTVGTYLYVELYMMVQEKSALFAALSALTDNIFKEQKRNAVFEAAIAASESAFRKLNLVAANSGYVGQRDEISSED